MIDAGGLEDSRLWASSPWVEGTSLADFVLHHGRIPPEAVLEIARAMLGELAVLEAAELVHGDIHLQNILIASDGDVYIPHPGLRGLIRPHEGISQHDLVPDACSTLAPERVTDGAPPSVASDLFACGCVWWHMLCGRPPLGCGDTLARLRAAQAAAVDDLHRWAADVPEVLVEAIRDCLQKDPRKRPKSMSDLARRLGPLRRHGRQAIARCLVATVRPRAPWLQSKRGKRRRRPSASVHGCRPRWSWPPWPWPGRFGLHTIKPQTHAEIASQCRTGGCENRNPAGTGDFRAGKRRRELASSTDRGHGGHSRRVCRKRSAASDRGWVRRLTDSNAHATRGRTSLAHRPAGSRRGVAVETGTTCPRARRTGTNRCSPRRPCGSG